MKFLFKPMILLHFSTNLRCFKQLLYWSKSKEKKTDKERLKMSLCQGPGVQLALLSPLISRCTGQVIHHGRRRKERDWPGLFVAACVHDNNKERLLVCVCIGCVSGFVLQPMLRGNHVSGSVISDSELQARRQNRTQLRKWNCNNGDKT